MKKIFVACILVMFVACSAFASEITPQYTEISVPLGDDDKFIVKCKTNLPDGTNISVWLYQIEPKIKPLYAGSPLDVQQTLILVKDGIVTAWFPTAYEKGLPSGKYDISFAIPQLQPNNALGKNNNRLGGSDIKVHANGHRGHEFRFGMKLPRNLKPHPKTPLPEETLTWDEMLDKKEAKK